MAFLMALVVNMSVIDDLQDYLEGTLSKGIGFNFGVVVKTTSLIMNVSVFNTSGIIQIGLLVFAALPLFAFYLADRNDNKEEGMDQIGFIVYMVASAVFTLLLTVLSFISKGELLSVAIDFVSLRNIIMTFVITLLIQIVIGMNYDVNRLPGILATRWMVRLMLGFAVVVSTIGLIVFLTQYTTNPMLILFASILLIPNIAIYVMFMMMGGISLNFNNELEQLLSYGQIELSYGAIPIGVRIALMAVFIACIFIALYRINQKNFFKGLLVFSISFPLICLLVALCTVIDLGDVKFIGSIRFGIDYVQALVYPFIAIIGIGMFDTAIKQMFKVIKD